MANKTQRECKDEFHAFCAKAIATIDEIDKETPAEPVGSMREPAWWLEMQDIRSKMQRFVNNYK